MKQASLDARVSGDDRSKEGRNLAGQLEMGREYAQEHGYQVVAELPEDDRGASGAEIDLPELNRVRDMAQAGEFDVLIVREIDRLSRSLAKQLVVEQELKSAGVSIEYVLGEYPDTPEGNLQKHVKAAVAEYEREQITRSMRGRYNKVKSGKIMLHGDRSPYGYRISEDGNNLVPFEPEARIVKLIFQYYTDGDETGKRLSMQGIADRLSEMKVPTWGDIHRATAKKLCHSRITNDKLYLYYHCRSRNDVARGKCGMPSFRADQVDVMIWNWLKDWVQDPRKLTEKLEAYQEEREKDGAIVARRETGPVTVIVQRRPVGWLTSKMAQH
jgi:site-specific DNA recombinase